jgi:hypothetical protein
MLLDVSRLDHCTVDAEAMTATVGPPVALPVAELGTVADPPGHGVQPRRRYLPGAVHGLGGPADDEKYSGWAYSNMAAMAHLASGVQLVDVNLGQRPAKFATDAAMSRLDDIRAPHDPSRRFHGWMGRT